MVICAAIFIGINRFPKPITWETFSLFGGYSDIDIRNGKIWALITHNFIHIELWHVAANLYWFWIFGKEIEQAEGRWTLLAIIFTSSLFASESQMIFGGTAGIGLSGVVYALFGYILLREKTSEHYTTSISEKTRNFFWLWLVLCFGLTWLELLNAGNAAHVGGVVWGMFAASMQNNSQRFRFALQSVVIMLFFVFTMWQPWSTQWWLNRAIALHQIGQLNEAEALYQEILKDHPFEPTATENIKRIGLSRLYDSAAQAHNAGKLQIALDYYDKILSLNPYDEWALSNRAKIRP